MDDVAFLPVYATAGGTDTLGRYQAGTPIWRQVFVAVQSVTYTERQKAAQDGLTAAYQLKLFYLDYREETSIRFRDKEYAVYRSYWNHEESVFELYLAEGSR